MCLCSSALCLTVCALSPVSPHREPTAPGRRDARRSRRRREHLHLIYTRDETPPVSVCAVQVCVCISCFLLPECFVRVCVCVFVKRGLQTPVGSPAAAIVCERRLCSTDAQQHLTATNGSRRRFGTRRLGKSINPRVPVFHSHAFPLPCALCSPPKHRASTSWCLYSLCVFLCVAWQCVGFCVSVCVCVKNTCC